MLYTKQIPRDDQFDVIVAGGGPSGCAAAAAAASNGAKTLLIEASGALGGMGTIGLVPAWCPYSDGENVIYRGIAQTVMERVKAHMPHIKADHVDWVPIDPEVLKRVYDDLVSDAGVKVLFNTQLCDVQSADGRVDSVIVANKAGLTAYRAKVFIDCTGDADIAAFCGLPYDKGAGETGDVQPATHCFTLTNVDEYAYQTGPRLHGSEKDCPIYDIVRSEKYPMVVDGHSCNERIGPGVVGFNAGHLWNVDSTDPFSMSAALMAGRKLADELHCGLIEFYPSAFAASHLTMTASALGTRESRRIVGEYTLTFDDYKARRTFPDEIGRNCYYIDVHHSPAQRDAFLRGEIDYEEEASSYGPGESHGIPYRCLVPKGCENLLVAGRTISCDRTVQGSVRVMPPCLVTGQAAGTAAAMIAANGGTTMTLDTDALRAKLRADGAYFL